MYRLNAEKQHTVMTALRAAGGTYREDARKLRAMANKADTAEQGAALRRIAGQLERQAREAFELADHIEENGDAL